MTWHRFTDYIRYAPVYVKTFLLVIPPAILLLGIGFLFLFPKADPASLRNGLTIIAEILGVLFGALLVITTHLAQEYHQAEQLLRSAYPKYRDLVLKYSDTVKGAFVELIELVKKSKIRITDSVYPTGGSPTYRDVLGLLVTLGFAIGTSPHDEAEKILKNLGFTEKEIGDFLYARGALAKFDPEIFLRLAHDALDYMAIVPLCSEHNSQLAQKIFEEFLQEGVAEALYHYQRSTNLLRSKLLAFDLTLVAFTTILAIVIIFGTPDNGNLVLSYYLANLTMALFLISTLVNLYLVGKILT